MASLSGQAHGDREPETVVGAGVESREKPIFSGINIRLRGRRGIDNGGFGHGRAAFQTRGYQGPGCEKAPWALDNSTKPLV
jgi:hypothetical protein